MKNALFLLLFAPNMLLCNPVMPEKPTHAKAAQTLMQHVDEQKSTFVLPALPYSSHALEPEIDAQTMDIHYNRHHRGYTDKLTKAVQGTEWQNKTMKEIFQNASKAPPSVKNNAGGHWNHSFFWACLQTPNTKNSMSDRIKEVLTNNFGSIDLFRKELSRQGMQVFGSGWVWLIKAEDGSLKLTTTQGHDNPLMDTVEEKGLPVLTCDVWEHAYYLKYQNHRDDYLDAFWSVINWDFVDKLLFP